MNVTQQAHQLKLADWMNRFKAQATSRLSVKAWCLQNNVSIHAYNYWKHKAKLEYLEATLPDYPEIVPLSPQALSPIPVANDMLLPDSRESCDSCNTDVSIALGAVRLKFDSSATDEYIFRILKAVRHA